MILHLVSVSNYTESETVYKNYNLTVPVIPEDIHGVPDYSVLSTHQPGQLYAYRNDNNSVVLRTLTLAPFANTNIGVHDAASGEYVCRAINGMEENTTNVTVMVHGWWLFCV